MLRTGQASRSKPGEQWVACLSCTHSQNPCICPYSCHLVLPPLSRTVSRVATHLDFAYAAERPGASCQAPSYGSSVGKQQLINCHNLPSARKWIQFFSQLCFGSCTTQRNLWEGRIWPLISLGSHSCCLELPLPNPLSSWAVFLL